jgi:tetratricopeptide (TPR) repeat protein
MLKKSLIFLAILAMSFNANSSDLMEEIKAVQKQWAKIQYKFDPESQDDAFKELIETTNTIIKSHPNKAEPLVWSAIIHSSYAGAVGGIESITKALPAVKKAKTLLLQAETINSDALDGSIYTTLGALYYQVPGWPLGFGNKKKARNYLEKAVKMSENGLDANYFYGDFLIERKQYAAAISALEKALQSPPIQNRPVADQGRRDQVRELLTKARSKIS